jgi:hypothetical protein
MSRTGMPTLIATRAGLVLHEEAAKGSFKGWRGCGALVGRLGVGLNMAFAERPDRHRFECIGRCLGWGRTRVQALFSPARQVRRSCE